MNKDDAAHFDMDNAALSRLVVRGYLTESQKKSITKKMIKEIVRTTKRVRRENDHAN